MGSKDTGLHHIVQLLLAGTVKPHGDEDRQYHGQSHKQHRVDHRIGLLWSSVFVTLVAKKYRFMQFELDMVFDTR